LQKNKEKKEKCGEVSMVTDAWTSKKRHNLTEKGKKREVPTGT